MKKFYNPGPDRSAEYAVVPIFMVLTFQSQSSHDKVFI